MALTPQQEQEYKKQLEDAGISDDVYQMISLALKICITTVNKAHIDIRQVLETCQEFWDLLVTDPVKLDADSTPERMAAIMDAFERFKVFAKQAYEATKDVDTIALRKQIAEADSTDAGKRMSAFIASVKGVN